MDRPSAMTRVETGRILCRLAGLACVRPAVTVGIALGLAAVSISYAALTLSLSTDERTLLPPGATYVQRSVEYDREFQDVVDALVVVVEAPSVGGAKAYAERLAKELQLRRAPLAQVTYRSDPRLLGSHALLYLSPEQLADLRDKIFDHEEFIQSFVTRPTLETVVLGMAREIAVAFTSRFLDLGLTDAHSGPDLQVVRDLVGQMSSRISSSTRYHSPWDSIVSIGTSAATTEGYFLSEDQRLLFVLAEPKSDPGSFTGNARAVEATRGVIAALRSEYPDVRVGVTGRPALSNDEMSRAFRDAQIAMVIAFTLTFVVLLVAFRHVAKSLLMLGVLGMSLCWALGIATITVGHLSLFSIMFISIVIGIGIDYGIYFLFRYEAERSLGRGTLDAIEVTATRSGPGMLGGALTAAGTFYALALTEFRGLQELGLMAGSAILCSWLAMMVVLPALLVVIDGPEPRPGPASATGVGMPRRARLPFLEWLRVRQVRLLAGAVVITVLSLWGSAKVRFDYNLLRLQAKETESVVWERRILAHGGYSSFAAFSRAGSLEELRSKDALFRKLPTVARVDSALILLPENQDEKLRIIRQFPPIVAQLRIHGEIPVDVEGLLGALQALRRCLELGASAAPPGEGRRELQLASAETTGLMNALRRAPRPSKLALGGLQREIYLDFTRSVEWLQRNRVPRPIGPEDLPDEFRRQFVSEQAGFLLQVFPAVDIWSRAGGRRFAQELRSVDPDVTGPAIISFEMIRLMERSYREATAYALGLVAVVTFGMLWRIRESILALLPLGLGLLWTIGLMGLLGLDFTMGNVFGLPLILGAAAEFGLNIVLSSIKGGQPPTTLIAHSTLGAVLVNGLTTIAGFASLLVASHRGIFGLGLLLTLGTVTTLIASLIVLPTLLVIVARRSEPERV